MAPKHDPDAVGETRLIDDRIWVIVAVYPIRLVEAAYA